MKEILCRTCGNPFQPRNSRNKECSEECAKIRKQKAKKDWDINHIEHIKTYRINRRPLILDKIKEWKHNFYIKHKSELLEKMKEYKKTDHALLLMKMQRERNKSKIILRRKRYRLKNPAQIKERDFLLSQYKTSRVSPFVKKLTAIIYIGRRITGFNQSKPIDFKSVPNKINLIKKGKTYEAYL